VLRQLAVDLVGCRKAQSPGQRLRVCAPDLETSGTGTSLGLPVAVHGVTRTQGTRGGDSDDFLHGGSKAAAQPGPLYRADFAAASPMVLALGWWRLADQCRSCIEGQRGVDDPLGFAMGPCIQLVVDGQLLSSLIHGQRLFVAAGSWLICRFG
jgi:hypothetical protein